jgi:hypothetical protein
MANIGREREEENERETRLEKAHSLHNVVQKITNSFIRSLLSLLNWE